MKNIILSLLILSISLTADQNKTVEQNSTKAETNSTSNIDKNLKKQMELEKKYEKEQKFYQGDEYDLKSKEIDKSSLDSIDIIEPEYDFDITDLYRDDI